MKIPAKNPYKSRQSFGKALNRCRTELPCSPQKHTVVVSGLAKEVGFSIQNIMRNNVMEIPASVMSLKKLLKNSSFDLTFQTPGAKDEMVVWDEFGKQQLRKSYLTMYTLHT